LLQVAEVEVKELTLDMVQVEVRVACFIILQKL
jgi:hypothetical protein